MKRSEIHREQEVVEREERRLINLTVILAGGR
jgi:hypothetical protein